MADYPKGPPTYYPGLYSSDIYRSYPHSENLEMTEISEQPRPVAALPSTFEPDMTRGDTAELSRDTGEPALEDGSSVNANITTQGGKTSHAEYLLPNATHMTEDFTYMKGGYEVAWYSSDGNNGTDFETYSKSHCRRSKRKGKGKGKGRGKGMGAGSLGRNIGC